VVVPTAAVQRGPNGTFAYVVQADNAVAVRPVTVTQQDDTQAVVTVGLTSQERVVTTGFARISDGTQVAVSNAEDTPPPSAGTEPPPRRGRRGQGGPKS
jgi:membrane fusion protein, multidrug efflux system